MTQVSNEIQVGERLDLQRGSLIYKGDGLIDVYTTNERGEDVLKQVNAPLTDAMRSAWHLAKARLSATTGTRTSNSL